MRIFCWAQGVCCLQKWSSIRSSVRISCRVLTVFKQWRWIFCKKHSGAKQSSAELMASAYPAVNTNANPCPLPSACCRSWNLSFNTKESIQVCSYGCRKRLFFIIFFSEGGGGSLFMERLSEVIGKAQFCVGKLVQLREPFTHPPVPINSASGALSSQ